jgi:hypothetical protein
MKKSNLLIIKLDLRIGVVKIHTYSEIVLSNLKHYGRLSENKQQISQLELRLKHF